MTQVSNYISSFQANYEDITKDWASMVVIAIDQTAPSLLLIPRITLNYFTTHSYKDITNEWLEWASFGGSCLIALIREVVLTILFFPFLTLSYFDGTEKDYDRKSENFIDFYGKHEYNSHEFRLQDILDITDDRDIIKHVKWLFPIDEKVAEHSQLPTATPKVISAFKEKTPYKNLERSFIRMLSCYGLKFDGRKVVKADNFDEKKKYWLVNNGANLTRMIKSLATLGRKDLAISLYESLESVFLETRRPSVDFLRIMEIWHSSIVESIPDFAPKLNH